MPNKKDEIKEVLINLAHTQRGNVGNPDEYIELLSIDQALKEMKLKVKDAYISGYERGHDDTVESRYENIEEKAEEYFNDVVKKGDMIPDTEGEPLKLKPLPTLEELERVTKEVFAREEPNGVTENSGVWFNIKIKQLATAILDLLKGMSL